MGRHMEAFRSRAMAKWLTDHHDATFDHQTGSHTFWKLPNGRTVGTFHKDEPVPCVLMRGACEAIGITYQQGRSEIGHPVVKAGKPKHTPRPTRQTVAHTPDLDVLRARARKVSASAPGDICIANARFWLDRQS